MVGAIKRLRARRWLRRAHVPVVPGLRLRQGGCPLGRYQTSCYLGDRRIGWSGSLKDDQDRHDLYHEAGHAFLNEFAVLATDRARIKRYAGWHSAKPWTWGEMPDPNPATSQEQPLEEDFADLYADLAMWRGGYPALRMFLQEIANRYDYPH